MPTNPDTAPVLLDTSAVIAHMVGHPEISRRIKAAERCFLPLTALGELRHGVHKSERQGRTKEAAKIERVLRIAEVLYPGDQTADQYGRMIDALEAQGQRIPTNDIWIAATAKQYDLPLIATDADFKRINGLGISTTEAIRMFLTQVRLHKGLPFEVKIPNARTQAAINELESGKGERFTSISS